MVFLKLLAVAFLAAALAAPEAEAESLAKGFTRSAMSKLFKRDGIRDAATVAKPLARPRHVWRYTSRRQAAIDARQGLAPGPSHHHTSDARAAPVVRDRPAPLRIAPEARGPRNLAITGRDTDALQQGACGYGWDRRDHDTETPATRGAQENDAAQVKRKRARLAKLDVTAFQNHAGIGVGMGIESQPVDIDKEAPVTVLNIRVEGADRSRSQHYSEWCRSWQPASTRGSTTLPRAM